MTDPNPSRRITPAFPIDETEYQSTTHDQDSSHSIPFSTLVDDRKCHLSSLSPTSPDFDVPLQIPSVADVGIDADEDRHSIIVEQSISDDHLKSHVMLSLCFAVMLSGAMNNVLGKIRSKPLGLCNYFVSIINAISYTIIYTIIFKYRQYQKVISKEELDFVWKTRQRLDTISGTVPTGPRSPSLSQNTSSSFWETGSRPLLSMSITNSSSTEPLILRWHRFREYTRRLGAWKYFVLSGFCDFAGNVVAMIAQPFIPGPLFALMNQATLPAAAILSYILLRRRYSVYQLLAILTVWFGGVLALLPDLITLATNEFSPTENKSDNQQSRIVIRYSFLVVLGTIPTALSSSIKEKAFKLYRKRQTIASENRNRASALEDTRELGPRRGCQQQNRILLETEEAIHGDKSSVSQQESMNQQSSMSQQMGENNDVCGDSEYPVHQEDSSIKPLDVFTICAYGSIFQLVFVPLAFPIIMVLGQSGGQSLSTFLNASVSCFLGQSKGNATLCHTVSHSIGTRWTTGGGNVPSVCWSTESLPCEDYGCCHWAPLTYIPYLIVNIIFNVLFLFLIIHGSAVVAFMTLKAILPLAVFFFALFNWPLLSTADIQTSPTILASLTCVCAGILWYHFATQRAATSS